MLNSEKRDHVERIILNAAMEKAKMAARVDLLDPLEYEINQPIISFPEKRVKQE